jgi:nucleotide-binding universal stress UspA family protein
MTSMLIGVDATGRSEDAVAFARLLAPATTGDLVVATIVPRSAEAGSPARDHAHGTVRRMSGLLGGVETERVHTAVIAERTAAQGLHLLAAAESAATVIVGSTHTGPLGRVRPGSTAERLLTGAPCAVAVVPHGYRTEHDPAIRRIGVAYDGSAEAKSALDAGLAAARALGASLDVITVIPSDVYGAPALMGGPGYIVVAEDVQADIRADLDATMAGIPADIPSRGVVLEGRPWRELVEASAKLDVLLVGSRGYGPLQAVILGGTGGPLMREARCPVVALPRGAGSGFAQLFASDAAAVA